MRKLSYLLCLIMLAITTCSIFIGCGKTFTVTFDLNGREGVIDQLTVKSGKTITKPELTTTATATHPNGTVYNLVLENWYNGEQVWDFNSDVVTQDITLKAKWTFEEDFFTPKQNADVRVDNTDVRVMSFNVLSTKMDFERPIEPLRGKSAVTTINRYNPDVVGVQEFNEDWYEYIRQNLDGYVIINDGNSIIKGGATNFCTLLYNKNSVKVIEYTQIRLLSSDHGSCRNVTIAVFEKLADGKRFIVSTTHLSLSQAGRKTQFNHIKAIVDEMLAKYPNLPFMLTGDYNCDQTSEEFLNFTSSYSVTCAENSLSKGLTCKSYHLGNGMRISELDINNPEHWIAGKTSFLPEYIETENCIDHIFLSSNTTSLYYSVIVDEDALNASDHCPIFADIKFN